MRSPTTQDNILEKFDNFSVLNLSIITNNTPFVQHQQFLHFLTSWTVNPDPIMHPKSTGSLSFGDNSC